MTGTMMATTRRRNTGPSAALSNATIQGYSSTETNPNPPPAQLRLVGTSAYSLQTNGAWSGTGDDQTDDGSLITSGTNTGGTWLTNGLATDCEVEAVLTSGTLTSGTTGAGTWQTLGSVNRTWTRQQTLATAVTTVITLTIRDKTTLVTLATATITLKVN